MGYGPIVSMLFTIYTFSSSPLKPPSLPSHIMLLTLDLLTGETIRYRRCLTLATPPHLPHSPAQAAPPLHFTSNTLEWSLTRGEPEHVMQPSTWLTTTSEEGNEDHGDVDGTGQEEGTPDTKSQRLLFVIFSVRCFTWQWRRGKIFIYFY